jgi:hypothetical protein
LRYVTSDERLISKNVLSHYHNTYFRKGSYVVVEAHIGEFFFTYFIIKGKPSRFILLLEISFRGDGGSLNNKEYEKCLILTSVMYEFYIMTCEYIK